MPAERGKTVYAPSEFSARNSLVGGSLEARQAMYERSTKDPRAFWATLARDTFHWETPFDADAVLDFNYDRTKGPVFQRWFDGGRTNVCYNALDRWLPEHRDAVAFHYEANEPGGGRPITYGELHAEVAKLAGVLRHKYGIEKGDRVSLYLPMVLAGPAAMLACARIGAMVSVVFGGFSAQSLASRLEDSQSKLLITADSVFRGAKPISLKAVADEAMTIAEKGSGLDVKCLVLERHGREGVPMRPSRDTWYQDAMTDASVPAVVECEWVDAEHPLFMLYTSGSTGKPKGLVHTTGGYMVWAATTFKYVFDYRPGDVYFCTADIGWITGHTYVVYGPLLNRATSVLFEGLPTYPTASRWWEIVDKLQVNQFYTAPTAVRALMKAGDAAVARTTRKSLRVLASVGEPINVAAWEWYYHTVGNGQADICDSWWQTETGGIMITPLPGTTPLKPGSASLPFFGVRPAVLDATADPNGPPVKLAGADVEGLLCIEHPWPGQARTIYGDHSRYEQTYFSYPGYYFSGDGCRRDGDGYYWLTGRVDDVVNVSGHRLGTSEVECAINGHPAVVESAVVGMPHDIKGEGIYAYVTFRTGVEITAELFKEVGLAVRKAIGPIAHIDAAQPAPGLPKTRSGKIMRRILRKIAVGQTGPEALGDTSTLAEPAVVPELIALREKWVAK